MTPATHSGIVDSKPCSMRCKPKPIERFLVFETFFQKLYTLLILIDSYTMMNQNRSIIHDIIGPNIQRGLVRSFRICQNDWGVTVRWGVLGILFSCPRDMNPNRYICEVSLVLADGSLTEYFRGNRHQLRCVHDIIPTIYEAYYYYEIISRIKIQALQFQLRSALRHRKRYQSLLSACLYCIGTLDIRFLRSLLL